MRTRRSGSATVTSTDIDLSDTTNAQTHTAAFTKDDITDTFAMITRLKSGSGTTRQENRNQFIIAYKAAIPPYPPNGPIGDEMMKQDTTADGQKIDVT